MSESNGLPKGWQACTLDSVGVLFCGQSPPTSAVNRDGKGMAYVTGPEQWDGSTLHIDKWTTAPTRVVPDGCVFITVKGAGVGTLFPGKACTIGRDVYAYKPTEGVLQRFIEHSLRFNIGQVLRHAKGDIPGLSKSHILEHEMGIPPLPEQNRIVEKIEELFSDLDAGVSALQRAKANLKRYRASVLKSAVEGRLTAEWRKEHPQAEDGQMLLERILRERREKWEKDQLQKFKEKGKEPPKNWESKYEEPLAPDTSELSELPEGWVWASLEAVADVTGGITKDKKKDSLPGMREVPYLRVANVQRGFLDLSEMKTIKASPEDIQELALLRGDVLFTEGGDRDKLGRGWVWSEELPECIHQNHIFRARLSSSGIQPSLVSHHGNTFGRQWFTKAGKQTTNLASINLGILKRFPVPLPPPAEQEQIVALVEERLSQIDSAEKTIDAELIRSKRLRQSILKRAFEGRLVPQDLKDEPASVLLERIKASREAEQPKKKAKKAKSIKTGRAS
jgi:type I restriction enzyme S subunit